MSARPAILLVEDNPITRKLVRFALQQEHFDLSEASDAATALELAETKRPDLILQDLLLPDMDGFALVTRFRAMPALSSVPIFAFSGLLSQLDEKRLSGSGFTDFVTKPIEPSQLVRMIRAHLPSGAPQKSFGAKRLVVLADDDEVQRKLSVFKLSRMGFEVVDVADGQAALEAARRSKPAAIITDAMMPVLDGFGLCAAVRQDAGLKDVPIVMLTSTYVDEADRELGQKAGANSFVIRTPDLREMATALETALAPSAPGAATPVVQTQDFERERASRTIVQLERQAAAASSARQQVALLSAELAVLNAISEAITQETDIDVVLREILAACCDAGGVSIGALYLLSAGGTFRTILVGSHAGWENGDAEAFLGDGTRLREFMRGAGAVVISRESAAEREQDWLRRSGLQSALVVPLQRKDHSLGALVMMSEAAELGADDRLLFAEAVGHQVSVALALTQAFKDSASAAQQAREQARLLQSVFSSITDPIIVVDQTGRPTTWNAAADALLGISGHAATPVTSEHWSQDVGVFHTDKSTLLMPDERPLIRALEGHNVERVPVYLKNAQRPDGAWLSISARSLRDDRGGVQGAVSVCRDVTAERLAQEQVLISDRMASIGMMAAGVGHEINNPLSAVVANLEMATADLASLTAQIGRDKLGELPDEIREAYDAAQRVRRIATDLKVFSGAHSDDNGPIDVEQVLESSVRMGWNQLRHRARVVRHYSGVPLANGASSRLGQVFLNLIVNAAQAIPEGHADTNEIRLTTRTTEHPPRIVIDVEDTGSGIAPHVMRQLFTPFVTTKPVGVGTGLGLSICQRLVNGMGGSIWADSTVGQGTVFHVALLHAQAAAVEPAAAAETSTAAAPTGRKRARILVIDDEEMIGLILRRALKAHDVTTLTNARDALDRIVAGERFDAILCDLMMPVMSGVEFLQVLSDRFPDQAAQLIFLTGGAFSKETAAFLDSISNTRLEKPFDVVKLRVHVEAHLAAHTPPRSTGEAS
jgi:PAS domain S-box-containing protein